MIGIDIVHLNRINLKSSFIDYILTDLEKDEFNHKHTNHAKIQYLGGRFAAKEAIYKATQDKKYLSYSVLNKENGEPYVSDHPEIEISISHDGEYVVAICLVKSI